MDRLNEVIAIKISNGTLKKEWVYSKYANLALIQTVEMPVSKFVKSRHVLKWTSNKSYLSPQELEALGIYRDVIADFLLRGYSYKEIKDILSSNNFVYET